MAEKYTLDQIKNYMEIVYELGAAVDDQRLHWTEMPTLGKYLRPGLKDLYTKAQTIPKELRGCSFTEGLSKLELTIKKFEEIE